MLRKLVLVRHGDAEFFGPEGTDASRRLSKHGKRDLKKAYPDIFDCLRAEEDLHVWVSPAVRALQTAKVLAKVLDIDPDDFDIHNSLYEQYDEEFLAELDAEGDGIVIAVGHIPFMNRMLYALTGEDIPFGKGSVACIAFADGELKNAQLEWFETVPKA